MTLTGRINDMDPDKLAALYDAGWTHRELADILGKFPGTIRHYLKKSPDYRPRERSVRDWMPEQIAERQAEAARLYRLGDSTYKVAAKLGVSQRTVMNDLESLGVERRPRSRDQSSPERRRRAEALYKTGLTIRQVAAELGATYSSIRRDLLALGVERRAASYRDPGIRERRREQVVHWYKKGETISMVAFRLGMSPVTVGNDLKAMGVSRRRSSWHD